jgi:hypothetical protein
MNGKPEEMQAMLDVHAPEHGIHGLRDFMLHLFTISVGLLIALGLESSVEAMHHRHQRKEAEVLVRQEIQDNLNKLQGGASGALLERDNMIRVMRTLEDISQGKQGKLHEEDFAFSESPIQDAAWRTASSTGVLAYMDYGEVEKFSDAYKEQALLQTMEEKALDDYLELAPLISHHSADMTAETAKAALPYARHVVAHLMGMLAVGQGTIVSYEAALKP